jgi:ABC-type transporter Mla subunit MlaD
MNQSTQKIWIGLFVLGGLIATGIMIIKFGDTAQLLRQGYIVNAIFDKVIGVQEGTEVTLAGIPVGRVKRVDLKNRDNPGEGAIVAMQIRNEFPIPKYSVATVIQPLMGQPVVNIVPPIATTRPARPESSPLVPLPHDGSALIDGKQLDALSGVLDPKMIATIELTTAHIGELAKALTPAAHDLHDLLQMRTVEQMNQAATTSAPANERLTANLYTAVERLHNVLARIEDIVGDPTVQSNFKDTLTNLRAASADAREAAAGFRTFSQQAQQTATKADGVLTKLDATLDTTHKNIDELGKSLLANSDRMAKMLDNFVLASKDMAEGKGTIGMLLRDPKFYEELVLTVQRLKEAAVDLQVLIRTWQKQGLLGAK